MGKKLYKQFDTLSDKAIERIGEVYFSMEGIIDDFDRKFDGTCSRVILNTKDFSHNGSRVEFVFEIEPVGLIKHEETRKLWVKYYIHSYNQVI